MQCTQNEISPRSLGELFPGLLDASIMTDSSHRSGIGIVEPFKGVSLMVDVQIGSAWKSSGARAVEWYEENGQIYSFPVHSGKTNNC
jgi:hypothetical protein